VSSTTNKVPKTPGSFRPGEDLSAVMGALRGRGEPMPLAVAVLIAREVARDLHDARIRKSGPGGAGGSIDGGGHRDVRPANIMLLRAGAVKVLHPQRAAGGKLDGGEPAYLAPELVRGGAGDHRSDIFSLGVVLWEMVAGQRLFSGETESETLQSVLTQPIAEASRRRDGIPATLDATIARALDREPANRYASVEAFASELDRFLAESPAGEQAVPQLLDELFTAPAIPKRDDLSGPTAARSGSGPTPPRHVSASRIYRTIPPPKPPRIPLPTLIGIFFMVVAVVVTVGRVVIRHQSAGSQSSSAKSVSTSR
jgi:serine/threonine-protein kinase